MPEAPPTTAAITADDATITAACATARVGALLPAVAQLTGDLSVLEEGLRPDPNNILDDEAGLTPDAVARARELAAEALMAHRDRGAPPTPPPGPDELRQLMAFVVGDNVDDYFGLLREELAADDPDPRRPHWHLDDVAPGRTVRAAVIGAGMSGLLVAHRLRQVGVRVTIVERSGGVGGTWHDNTYPGCRVDVPNHLYSYSFDPALWPQQFSTQPVLAEYFADFATSERLGDHLRLNTEVTSARWDATTSEWTLALEGPGGPDTLTADVVVSATGQLNRPRYPDIDGLDTFGGPMFHSARWDHDVDLAGKRVAVVGTGASAMQFIPEIAPDVAHLTVFQRTPAWLVPTPDYHDTLDDAQRWLFAHVPSYAHWYRLWLFWRTHEGLLGAARVDPAWDGGEQSVSAANELVRAVLVAYLNEQFGDDPELAAKVLPGYPPIAKRVIRDNGVWARALKRPNVDLETTGIREVTAGGITTTDGNHHPCDVIVLGTGFTASDFLVPMQVTGTAGTDLHEVWSSGARAYLGMTVPGFPNFFCLYGPNTNIVINGSIIFFSECAAHYITESIRLLARTGARSMDLHPGVLDAFSMEVDAANATMAWGASSVNSWYKDAAGRVTQNWPFSLLEYWERTRVPDPASYDLT